MRSILFVDDEPGSVYFASLFFRDLPYQFHTADSPEKALEMLERRSFDVVISDFNMPGMNGLEFFRQVRPLHPETFWVLASITHPDLFSSEMSQIPDPPYDLAILKPYAREEWKHALDLVFGEMPPRQLAGTQQTHSKKRPKR